VSSVRDAQPPATRSRIAPATDGDGDQLADAAIVLLSQRVDAAIAIDNINSEFGDAVPALADTLRDFAG
jgi:hypothetical protein